MSENESASVPEGNPFPQFDKGVVVLESIWLAKVMEKDGSIKYREVMSKTLHPVEALGMVTTMQDSLRQRIMNGTRFIGE